MMYLGRSLTSSKIRPMYSPNIPIEKIIMPLKKLITTIVVTNPDAKLSPHIFPIMKPKINIAENIVEMKPKNDI